MALVVGTMGTELAKGHLDVKTNQTECEADLKRVHRVKNYFCFCPTSTMGFWNSN